MSRDVVTSDVIVSFDVVSLVTKVLIDVTVEAAQQKLENDPSLSNCSTLTPSRITDLLSLILRSTNFRYNGSIYEQTEGAAVGNTVSVVIANLYMVSFEEHAVTSSSCKPRICKCYLDGTFTILARDSVENFPTVFQPPTAFHLPHHGDGEQQKFAFLDTAFTREPDGRLITSVYMKQTHTDQYLQRMILTICIK